MKKFKGRDDWFDVWYDDTESMIHTMYKNMAADILAGYDPQGYNINYQREQIYHYIEDRNRTMKYVFVPMDEEQVNRWCYYDLKSRGAIE